MPTIRSCPALFISAPSSNEGKTTIVASLARYWRNQGKIVRVFKTGPDFLDPMILEFASGHPVHQLDLWMAGESECKRLLYEAAKDADLILIEGVMGLFDGEPSSADLAQRFGIPILAVIDASGMAQTFLAIAHGLKSFRPQLPFAGVLANRVGSPRHAELLVKDNNDQIKYFGGIPKTPDMQLPDRHLGLVQASEIQDLNERLEIGARKIADTALATLPEPINFNLENPQPVPQLLKNIHIAVAKDDAFSFLYAENLNLLKEMGTTIEFFSLLNDQKLPEADAIYLPGGYPELHLSKLENNATMRQSLIDHFQVGKSIYAECGGMLYLLDSLTDKSGETGKMLGLVPGTAVMQSKLSALGYQSIELPQGVLRGHTFHHSITNYSLTPTYKGKKQSNGADGEPMFQIKGLTASYLHLYFRSNPIAAASFFTINPKTSSHSDRQELSIANADA